MYKWCSCIVIGSDGLATLVPVNVIGLEGENFTLKAEGDTTNEITWHDTDHQIANDLCQSTDDMFTTYNAGGDDRKCYLLGSFIKERTALYHALFEPPQTYYIATVVTIGEKNTSYISQSSLTIPLKQQLSR